MKITVVQKSIKLPACTSIACLYPYICIQVRIALQSLQVHSYIVISVVQKSVTYLHKHCNDYKYIPIRF